MERVEPLSLIIIIMFTKLFVSNYLKFEILTQNLMTEMSVLYLDMTRTLES